jgi:hypothetical protein
MPISCRCLSHQKHELIIQFLRYSLFTAEEERKMKGAKILFLASWIIMLVLSIAICLISLTSLRIAYFSPEQDSLTPTMSLKQLEAIGGQPAVDAAKAIQGRRATAATWAFGYGLLAVLVTLFPYRRGEKWAWWALLLSLGLSQLLAAARVVTIGSSLGSGAAVTILAALLLALLAGVPHIFAKRDPDEIKIE